MPRIRAEYVGRSGPVSIDVDEALERCTADRLIELANNEWCTTHDGIGQVVVNPDDALDWLATNRPDVFVQVTERPPPRRSRQASSEDSPGNPPGST